MKKLFAVLFLLATLVACSEKRASFVNTDITGLEYAKGFSLKDHNGKPVTLETYKGKVVVMFFGFTQCPDVCPTTMAEMAAVMKELGPQAKDVQVLFVTLDPERDTPEVLKNYVKAFHPSFVALRGTPEQTRAAAQEIGEALLERREEPPGLVVLVHVGDEFRGNRGVADSVIELRPQPLLFTAHPAYMPVATFFLLLVHGDLPKNVEHHALAGRRCPAGSTNTSNGNVRASGREKGP